MCYNNSHSQDLSEKKRVPGQLIFWRALTSIGAFQIESKENVDSHLVKPFNLESEAPKTIKLRATVPAAPPLIDPACIM